MSRKRAIPPSAWVLLLSIACVGLAGCFGMSKELRRDGVTAPATILEVWDTGMTVNDSPVVGLKVRIEPSNRPPFEATIKRTAISRLDVPQFQPGRVVPVRFDPKNPAEVAVDFEAPDTEPAPSSGNPYRDHFTHGSPAGAIFLPPPPTPALYLGTSDSASDTLALVENGYALIGAASAKRAPDAQLALDEGKTAGAALVVVYGRFDPPAEAPLAVVPFRPSPRAATAHPLDMATLALVPVLAPGDQFATYWGKIQPPILGIYTRPLTPQEKAKLHGKDGVLVDGVTKGSPAAAVHIALGDVIVTIDGKPVSNSNIQETLKALAGRKVTIDVVRGGEAVSVSVQLGGGS